MEDGIGERKKARFPRVGHGIRRLVVIGSDGVVSLAALRWLADQDAAFVMLDRDGSVLATTGPVRSSDARIRRAQALAHSSCVALDISRDLIRQKIEGQARLVQDRLKNAAVAASILRMHVQLPKARTIDEVRSIEAQAAREYWSAWWSVPVNFPNRDFRRTPDHWRCFGTRASLLTGSPRLATNPANAMLNYLYAVLESETRLALAALGLDPGLGVLHADSPSRDNLALDVMEPIRPEVDTYLLDWISREILRREWFFEQPNGCCRLMGSFAVKLSETALTWANAIAPIAESVYRQLWSTTRNTMLEKRPPTRLTQTHRREVNGTAPMLPRVPAPLPETSCEDCGAPIATGYRFCRSCRLRRSAVAVVEVAKHGRLMAQSEQARKRRSETMRKQTTAVWRWKESDLPPWLNRNVFIRKIQPRLKDISPSQIKSTLEISMPYAIDIRKGRRVPHPRHWQALASLLRIPSSM